MIIRAAHLKKVIVSLLESAGTESEHADIVADVMVMADLRGISTHGIYFLPMLLERAKAGLLNIPTKVEELSVDGAACHLDGGNGLGQVAAARGMRLAIKKASESGIGMTLIRNTNHIGLLAYYSRMATNEGMVGFCACNSASAMAPWGGSQPFFGTNPFSIAAPAGNDLPIILDMSTSIVARGKVRKAVRLGEEVPLGWALDGDGIPTTNPAEAMKGTLLPIGGPKGYGMAFFIDLLCGLVSGSKFATEVNTFHKLLEPTGVGVMAMAIDISRFMPLENYYNIIDGHISRIKNSEKAVGVEKIYMPGEIEAEKEAASLKDGIAIDAGIIETINILLKDNGIGMKLS